MRATCAILLLILLAATPASATPSFALVISFGGIDELAVGQTVMCSAYRPAVHRDHETGWGMDPLTIPFRWKVAPKDLARITADGRLTALKPGRVTVYVEDARKLPPGELPAGMPGQGSLTLTAAKELPLGRLPQTKGVLRLDSLGLSWKEQPGRKAPRLNFGFSTMAWSLWFETAPPVDRPLPWTCRADAKERSFSANTYHGPLFAEKIEWWRKDLVAARLTIRSWKDGIVRGRLTAETRQKVSFDFTFTARLADPSGLLLKAAQRSVQR